MSKSFVKNAGILAISVIIAKILGAVYRVPLTSLVGAEGMGLYQFVYPVFALMLTLSSGAVPNAISIAVSEKLALGDENGAKRAFSASMAVCSIIGSIGTVLLVALAYPVTLLQSKDAFLGYIAIAPAILIVTLISGFRGWFMGHGNLIPGSISQITEGTVKLGVGLALTSYLLKYGIKYAVVGALLGVVASECVTLIIMGIAFIIKDKRFVKVKLKDEKDTLKRLATLALPLVLGGMILPLSQFIDSLVVVNLLKLGKSQSPIAEYGLWSGVVTPLLNLPVMVCITLGIAITPQMVEGRQKRDIEFILEKSATANKLTFLLGIPFVVFYFVMAKNIIGILFPTLGQEKMTQAVLLLRISAISVPGLSLFQIYSAMLQGLGRAVAPVKIMAMSMTIKLLLSVVLVPILGVTGCAIAATVGYEMSGVWIALYFANFVNLERNCVKNISIIALCGGIMGIILFMFSKLQTSITMFVATSFVAGVVYLLAILNARVLNDEELKTLPMSKFFIGLNKKINGEKKT